MTAMDDTETANLEQRCEDYLDGRLSEQDTCRFERGLSCPEQMRIFGETLALRELLQSLGPEAAPEGLAERIQADLGVAASQTPRRARSQDQRQQPNATLATVQASLLGLGWMLRGPALAASATVASASGGRETLSGLQTARYALGPLTGRTLGRARTLVPAPPKPLWRRALRWVRR